MLCGLFDTVILRVVGAGIDALQRANDRVVGTFSHELAVALALSHAATGIARLRLRKILVHLLLEEVLVRLEALGRDEQLRLLALRGRRRGLAL